MLNFITDEHRMISDSVRRSLDDLATADNQERLKSNKRIAPAAVRSGLQEIGLFSGLDRDFMDTPLVHALTALESGRVSLVYPVIENLAAAYLWANASQQGVDDAVFAETTYTLPGLADAVAELPVLTDNQLDGTAFAVPFADTCDEVIVFARRKDAAAKDETVLVKLKIAQAGVKTSKKESVEEDYPVFDLSLQGVKVDKQQVCAKLDDGRSAADALSLHCSLLAAAEMAGVGEKLLNTTRDYLLVRSQFGSVLGTNQVLKHRLADNFVKLEALKVAVNYAAAAVGAGAEDAKASVFAAKQFAGQIGKTLAEDMLQMHGAIGYTMEYPLHLYMRRMFRLAASHGSTYVQGEKLYGEFQAAA